MITITSPSMALNDPRVECAYSMDFTYNVGRTTSMRAMADMVLEAARTVPGGRLRNVVLTAHGGPSRLELGAGLNSYSMTPFGDIKGKVHKVWFTGCLTGRIIGPETASQGDGRALQAYGITTGDGHAFLSAFAKLTGAYVVAPTEMQMSSRSSYPRGLIDSFEGLVLCYSPAGRIIWQRRYRSLFGHDIANRTATNPNWE